MPIEFRPTTQMTEDEVRAYAYEADAGDWHNYDYKTWPSADLSFPDIAEGEKRDAWFYKPNLNEVHFVDLYQFKSGAQRKSFIMRNEMRVPDFIEDAADWDKDVKPVIQELQDALAAGGSTLETTLAKYGLDDAEHCELSLEYADLSRKADYAVAQKELDAVHADLDKQMNANIEAVKAGGDLDPFEGVSLEDWAGANAKLASGTTIDEVLQVLGLEQPEWDAITAEWNARMTRDTTMAIMKVYGDAFANPNIGRFAMEGGNKAGSAADAQEITFEKWVEIQEAMTALTAQGMDAGTVLQQFGMNELDWATVGGQMSMKMASDISLAEKYDEYAEKYRAQYAGGTVADDLDF